MTYDVVVSFTGEAEITVEADSPEEARGNAYAEFSPIDISEVDITCVDVIDPEDDE